MVQLLEESKKRLKVYKKIVDIMGDYVDIWVGTGLDDKYDVVLSKGISILPTDKRALMILDYMLQGKSSPAIMQDFLNMRFQGLPSNIRPFYIKGQKRITAMWNDGTLISDKIFSLINLNKKNQSRGYWCDVDGKPVTLFAEKK